MRIADLCCSSRISFVSAINNEIIKFSFDVRFEECLQESCMHRRSRRYPLRRVFADLENIIAYRDLKWRFQHHLLLRHIAGTHWYLFEQDRPTLLFNPKGSYSVKSFTLNRNEVASLTLSRNGLNSKWCNSAVSDLIVISTVVFPLWYYTDLSLSRSMRQINEDN